jgi:hypothetical protein
VKRYAFSRRTRFRFVEQDDSDAGDFEVERRTRNGNLIAISLEQGGIRTFSQLELRLAIAEQRLHFHLEGRHAHPSADGQPSISPREPDFSALPTSDRDIARHRYEAIRPLIGKVDRRAADVRQRAEAVAHADPNKLRTNARSSVSERTLSTWLRWYEEAGDIRGLLPHPGDRGRGRPSKSEELHQIIDDRIEARWLQLCSKVGADRRRRVLRGFVREHSIDSGETTLQQGLRVGTF